MASFVDWDSLFRNVASSNEAKVMHLLLIMLLKYEMPSSGL